MDQLKKRIGARIKARRSELGISQDELAEKIGVSRTTIIRYESGQIENMRTDKIMVLADVLHTEPNELLGWKRQDGSELLDFIINNRWSEMEVLKMIDYGKFIIGQRGDDQK